MDYAFAPGTTQYDRMIRNLLTYRQQTTLVSAAGGAAVKDFFDGLTGTVTTPLTYVLIGTHGDEAAWMQIQLNAAFGANTTYEFLERALVAPRSCQLADAVINARPLDASNNPIPAFVYIKGCRIGKAVPFLTRFKEVINGLSTTDIGVSAPVFFHSVYELRAGVFEFFDYDFQVYSKTRLANKAALVAAITAKAYDDIHGTAIPAASWAAWIPTNIHRTKEPLVTVRLNPSPVANFSSFRAGRFKYDTRRVWSWTVHASFGALPTTQADIIALLKAQMAQWIADGTDAMSQQFADTHDFPYYERYSYTSVDDMIDNLHWSRAPRSRTFVGSRHEYLVNPPVTGPASNELIFNFYANPAGASTSVINFTETDTRFFQTA